MPEGSSSWREALEEHGRDRYAHAPILLDLHSEMTELQKLGWQIRGGIIVLGAFVAGGVLVVGLHMLNVI